MYIDKLTSAASYIKGALAALPAAVTKQVTDNVAWVASTFLQNSANSYCLAPPGSQFTSNLTCSTPEIAVREFTLLMQNCSAVRVTGEFCKDLLKKITYGDGACTLAYNDPIYACFDSILNATVPSSPLPNTSSVNEIIIGSALGGALVLSVVVVVACAYNHEKIARCCRGLRKGSYGEIV